VQSRAKIKLSWKVSQDSLIFARDCTEFLLELKLYNLIGI